MKKLEKINSIFNKGIPHEIKCCTYQYKITIQFSFSNSAVIRMEGVNNFKIYIYKIIIYLMQSKKNWLKKTKINNSLKGKNNRLFHNKN